MEKDFYNFTEARKIVRNLDIKNSRAYPDNCKFSKFNSKLPKDPPSYYKDSGWLGWNDFLGNNNTGCGIRKYKVNDNYFKKWSHNMAYILGFWFSDGHIRRHTGTYEFSIAQNIRGKYLLEAFLKDMKSTYPIKFDSCKKNFCKFTINSKEIYDDIIRLGGKERKSLDVEFPNIPDEFLPDFVRGLWDGDGTITEGIKTKSGQKCGQNAYIASGSKKFIVKAKKVFESHIKGIKTKITVRFIPKGSTIFKNKILKKDSTLYMLSLNVNDTKELRDFMYSNRKGELRLNCKYERFMAAGEYRPTPGSIKYMKFKDVKKLMARKKFTSNKDYHKWIKANGYNKCTKNCKRKIILPYAPDVVYPEWQGWSKFLQKA